MVHSELTDYMNEHVVPLVGHTNAIKGVMETHGSLPNGDCWIYTGIRCAEHEAVFDHSPAPIFNFRMSPGHYLVNPHFGPVATGAEVVLIDDAALPDEGSVDFWIAKYKEAQSTMGTGLTKTEYAAQKEEFTRLANAFSAGKADAARLRSIASDARAAFREEAGWMVAELSKAESEDVSVTLTSVEGQIGRGEIRAALEELRRILASGRRNLQILRTQALMRGLERLAWERLSLARGYATIYKDPAAAKEQFGWIIDQFPGTRAQECAKKEMP